LILLNLRKLKEPPQNLSEFGRSLNAAALLTGNIMQAAGKTRIEFELLDVAQNKITWSRSFEWNPTRIADTGSQIASSVLGAMALPGLTQNAFAGTSNPAAYDAFLSGKQQAASLNISMLLKAMDDFQRAIDLDPGYVLAYVELSETIRWYNRYRGPEEEERKLMRDRAIQALEAAQRIDSDSAAVVSALGLVSGDRSLAVQAFEHALELDPNHAKSYHRLGREMMRKGKLHECERLTRKALDLDPLNADWHNDLAGVLFELGRDEEALTEIHRSIELEPRLAWNHHRLSIWSGYHFGRLDDAVIYAREAYSLDPDNGGIAWEVMGWYADLGAREEALAWLDRQLEAGPGDPWRWFGAGVVAKYFGDKQKALEYIEKTLEIEPGLNWAMREMDFHDIGEGRPEIAWQRWQSAYPALFINETPTVDDSNFGTAIMLAQFFIAVGETERAEYLLTSCLDILKTWMSESSARDSSLLDTEQEIYASLGMKDETLEALRESIIDRNWRATPMWYDLPIYDFIRDDPQFQELMDIVHSDLAEQRQRVRAMECNGELAPAPGVELVLVCD
jgi:tetratricopeptide (TPR) repeat protein